MSIGQKRNREAEQPFEYPAENFQRFPRRGEESIDDLESYLKGQLIELQKEYHKRAEPIIKQLCKIEAMRPPRPIVIDASMIDPDILAQLLQNAGER